MIAGSIGGASFHPVSPGVASKDVGRLKTPKGRSRRGIVFYSRRGFLSILPSLAGKLALETKIVLRDVHV